VQSEPKEEGYEKTCRGGRPEDSSASGGGGVFRRDVPGEELWSCHLRRWGWEIEGAPGFHEEAKESVGVGVFCGGGEMRAGGGECEQAKQRGIADRPVGCVVQDEDVRDEVAAEGALVLQAGGEVGERVGSVEGDAGLVEKVAQLCDVFGVASGELFEL
jgi:hypothetical protein